MEDGILYLLQQLMLSNDPELIGVANDVHAQIAYPFDMVDCLICAIHRIDFALS